MTTYKYTDDGWYDGSEDCPCCSGLYFECYNSVGWVQNGSASSLHELYSQVLLDYLKDDGCDDHLYLAFNPYKYFTLEELKNCLDNLGVVLKEVTDV